VDSVDEQVVLESLLEDAKPPLPDGSTPYHYLISTPFRYPPILNGSRFGSRLYRGIFYASLEEQTALAETAYYRFVFWDGMVTPPPGGRLTTEHTTFSVKVRSQRGVRLEEPPFQQYVGQISHPADYQASQMLGNAMRESEIDAFTYISARNPSKGLNLGCFKINAIASKAPLSTASWTCITMENEVAFLKTHAPAATHMKFPLEQFLYEEKLPLPAV
jgi:hypothetical protein